MKKNKYIVIAVLALVLVFSAACAAQPEAEAPVAHAADMTEDEDMAEEEAMEEDTMAEEPAQLELTLEELAEFDGKDGKPAYVAVDGIIYDMTDSAMWRNGEHNGFSAGQDLTDVIKNQSPHGVKNLERVPAVGVLVE